MSLPYKVSDMTTLPEAARSFYVQKDGAFFLDADGVVPASEIEGLKKNRDDLKAEKQKAIADYQALLENTRLTDEERANLKARVDELESQVLSKEEIAAKAVKKAREEAATEAAKIKAQADHYQQLYTTSTIEAALTRAAQEHGAYSAAQIHGLLAGQTKLEAVTDDEGKPTGEYKSMTTVTVLDGDKRVQKTLPSAEAVQAFLSLPENKNLVDSKFQPGGGASGGRAGAANQNWHDLSPVERLNRARGV